MVVRSVSRGRVVLDLLLRSPTGRECAVWNPVVPRSGRRISSADVCAANAWRGLVCRASSGVACTAASAGRDARSRVGFLAGRLLRMDELWKSGDGRKSFSKLESAEVSYDTAGAGGGGGSAGGAGYGGEAGGGGPGDGAQPSRSSSGWRSLLAWYMSMVDEHPIKTKALTAGVLNVLGDLISQLVFEKHDYDLKRSAIFFVLGLALVGPTLHYWYLSLSKMVSIAGPPGAGLRLLFDQLFFAPVFIAAFFCALLTLEGRPSDIGPKLNQDWASVVVTNWKIWVPFQFLNFLLIPQPLQVGASNVIAVVWNVYLSYSSHKEVESTKT